MPGLLTAQHYRFNLELQLLIAVYGFVLNAFYSLGYSVDSYLVHRSKGQHEYQRLREALFWVGTFGSAGMTFVGSIR